MATISLSIPVAGSVTLALHQNNYAAIQAAVNALDTVNYADASVTRPKLATVTRKAQLVYEGGSAGFTLNLGWPDAATNSAFHFLVVPDDYVSGDITIKLARQSASSANTAKMTYQVDRYRDAVALSTIIGSTAIDFVPNGNTQVTSITVTAANFQAGDILRLYTDRDGAGGADTLAATVNFQGVWAEYTGRS